MKYTGHIVTMKSLSEMKIKGLNLKGAHFLCAFSTSGLAGFARLCPGDQYEVRILYIIL